MSVLKSRKTKHIIELPVARDFLVNIVCFIGIFSTGTLLAQYFIRYIRTSSNISQSRPGSFPRCLHYVWIQNREADQPFDLTVLQYLSILSAIKFLPSDFRIFVHTNGEFAGPLWTDVSDYISVVPASRIFKLNDRPIMHIEHEADMVKLDVAYNTGGFFVDFDVYFTGYQQENFLKLLDRYECIFTPFTSRSRKFLAIGNFGCKPKSLFIRRILDEYSTNYRGYKCYAPDDPIPFLYNGCLFPYLLYQKDKEFRKSVRIEAELLNIREKRGDFLNNLGKVEWKDQFNMHSGYEGREPSLSDVWSWNTSFGDLLRHIAKD